MSWHLVLPIVNMLHSYAFIALLPSFPFPIIWKIPFPAFEFKHHDKSHKTCVRLPAASHAIAWTTTSAIPWKLCKKPNNPFIFHVSPMETRGTDNKQQATSNKHCFSLRSMFCRMGFGFTEFHLQKRRFLQLVNPRPVSSNSEHARRVGLPPLLRHPADASPPSRPHARPKHRRPWGTHFSQRRPVWPIWKKSWDSECEKGSRSQHRLTFNWHFRSLFQFKSA